MMKVSDPIIFGHAVSVFFRDVFKNMLMFSRSWASIPITDWETFTQDRHAAAAAADKIEEDIKSCYADRPQMAMVNSDKESPTCGPAT